MHLMSWEDQYTVSYIFHITSTITCYLITVDRVCRHRIVIYIYKSKTRNYIHFRGILFLPWFSGIGINQMLHFYLALLTMVFPFVYFHFSIVLCVLLQIDRPTSISQHCLVSIRDSYWSCWSHHNNLISRYGISVSYMTTDMFPLS